MKSARAGSAAIALLAMVLGAGAARASDGKAIAVTVDDLPMQREGFPLPDVVRDTGAILASLKHHGVPATGFVNEDKLLVSGEEDARTGLLEDWLDAGMDLGNHDFGHVGFQDTPIRQYEDAVLRGEVTTRRLCDAHHRPLRYYRYPYNQTGPTREQRDAFQAFLRRHGYAVAPMTVEDDDTIFATVYADDVKTGDTAEAEAVIRSYLANLDKALDTFEGMSTKLFGRQIRQVLLIHANRLNADTLDRTLDRIERRGYRFVSLDDALTDPAYGSPDGYVGPYGPSWLRRWADGMARKIRPLGQPDPEAWVQTRFDAIRAQAHPDR